MNSEDKRRLKLKRKCKFPSCDRDARKGSTMCSRHYSAGDAVSNDKRKMKRKLSK